MTGGRATSAVAYESLLSASTIEDPGARALAAYAAWDMMMAARRAATWEPAE